jgi:hypothetical protein
MTHQNTHVFPPALIPILRARLDPKHACVDEVPDEVLTQLVTTIFFAGLQTYEAERYPVRVVFVGKKPLDVVLAESETPSAMPIYRWKALRFTVPRPFSLNELAKLAVVAADDRMYSIVRLLDEGLAITGLAREGTNFDRDPFLKLTVLRPGGLVVHSGRDRILDYEHGTILGAGDDLLFSTGSVCRGLEAIARDAEVDASALPEYLRAVQGLIHEMSAHGHGGILIISTEERPDLPEDVSYCMALDSSLVTLLRLSRLIASNDSVPADPAVIGRAAPTQTDSAGRAPTIPSSHLLRSAFLTETERVIKEIGALTAIDGATVVNRNLALVGFGVTLPVVREGAVKEAYDIEGEQLGPFEFGARGTRHRAGVAYASQHPGSLVFVASQDGPVTCIFRPSREQDALVWRLDRIHGKPA